MTRVGILYIKGNTSFVTYNTKFLEQNFWRTLEIEYINARGVICSRIFMKYEEKRHTKCTKEK